MITSRLGMHNQINPSEWELCRRSHGGRPAAAAGAPPKAGCGAQEAHACESGLQVLGHINHQSCQRAPSAVTLTSWLGMQNQIDPSDEVMAGALQLRREHLSKLGLVLKKRMDVNQVTLKALGRSSLQGSASSHASKLLVVRNAGNCMLFFECMSGLFVMLEKRMDVTSGHSEGVGCSSLQGTASSHASKLLVVRNAGNCMLVGGMSSLGVVLKKRMDVNQVTLKAVGRSSLQGSASSHNSKLLVVRHAGS